jgi:phospholipid N-methyltransferase
MQQDVSELGKSRHLGVFLAAVLRSPATVGAVAPSSTRLANQLAAVVPSSGEPVVVELGPGTGSVTAAVQRRLGGRGRHLTVELDPVLADYVQRENPGVEVVIGDAAALGTILAARDIPAVDAVVSGLPWSLFPPNTQRAILEVVTQVLCPAAAFTTFAYVHALPMGGARRLRSLLDELFDEVLTTRTVWSNLPPAVTYVCRRPRFLCAEN